MTCRLAIVSLICVTAWSTLVFAEEFPDSSDSNLTEQEWRQRVEEARRRSEEYVAKARSGRAEPTQTIEEANKIADARAMNDPELRRGDIVSTSKGLFVFVGREDADRQSSDFIPAPETLVPAARLQRR